MYWKSSFHWVYEYLCRACASLSEWLCNSHGGLFMVNPLRHIFRSAVFCIYLHLDPYLQSKAPWFNLHLKSPKEKDFCAPTPIFTTHAIDLRVQNWGDIASVENVIILDNKTLRGIVLFYYWRFPTRDVFYASLAWNLWQVITYII